jgi:hypothetical protein
VRQKALEESVASKLEAVLALVTSEVAKGISLRNVWNI